MTFVVYVDILGTMKIAPSILDADFSKLQSEVNSIASADQIHLDIMDGKYVPNKTFRAKDLSQVNFPVETDAHLMCDNPEIFFDEFQKLGVVGITFHIENTGEKRALELFQDLKSRGLKAGICIDGYTGAEALSDKILREADKVLVMSVKAGKGGQSFMPESCEKIRALRARGFQGEIEVDGGVNLENVQELARVGADTVVVGSFLMKKPAGEREGIIEEFQKA